MNFGDIPAQYSKYESSAVAILPVPFDMTSTWIKGADKGPETIIKASSHMELYDCVTQTEVYKEGICTLTPLEASDPEELFIKVRKKTSELIDHQKNT